jgi:hypothetical protein
MQRFHKGRLFEHEYWDDNSGEVKTMKGRIRLCPYYFVEADRVRLRGALATIAPADKKFLHGMRDAIVNYLHSHRHVLRTLTCVHTCVTSAVFALASHQSFLVVCVM